MKGRSEGPEDTEILQTKRNQIELIVEMLKATREPVKKTHLIYSLQINHYQLKSYLEMLTNFAMIEETSKPFRGYLITEKGRTLLGMFSVSEV